MGDQARQPWSGGLVAEVMRENGLTALERACDASSSYVDVIDRVLDKGIVIEAWMRLSAGGIDLITLDARVIVASIDTYLAYWPARNGAATMAKRRISWDD
jgi:hypothetical protein